MTQTKLKTNIHRENGMYEINVTESNMTVSLGKFEDQCEALLCLMEYKRMRTKNRRLQKTEKVWERIIREQERRNDG